MGVQIPHEKGQFWGKWSPIVKYRDFLPWAVKKPLNWSICRLSCGLGWAKGNTSSIVFARWRQCAIPCGHIGPTWRIRLNRPSAAAMRSYVKLLWPLVIIIIRPHCSTTYRLAAVYGPKSEGCCRKSPILTYSTCIWRLHWGDPVWVLPRSSAAEN